MSTLLVASYMLLFACTSMYFGTGWSLVLFSFPTADQLTPDNYYSHFVPQVEAATRFFTYMTNLMIILAIVMIVGEWGEPLMWVPWVVVAGIVAATTLTIVAILPLNRRMKEGITDTTELGSILKRWMSLNRVRVAIWTIQWLAMAIWFVSFATEGR